MMIKKRKNLISICHWEITKKCNLECIHCISSTRNKKELSTPEALQIINTLKNFGCKELYLTGGEPLLRKDFFEILKKAKQKKMFIGVITNGVLINKKNIEKLKLYINELGISLDGSSSEINDTIRGKGVFKKVIQAIKLVNLYRIPLVVCITLNRVNLNDFENFLNFINSLGIKRVQINEVSLRGRAYQNRSRLKISIRSKEHLKENLLMILRKHSYKIRNSGNRDCSINPKTIFLSPTGYIYPCIEIFQKRPNCYFGNIQNISAEKFQKYKEIILELSKKNYKCPYEEIEGNNFSLILNSIYIKSCPVEKKLCDLIKSIH